MTKKKMFNQTFVEMLFNISGSKLSIKWNGRLNKM